MKTAPARGAVSIAIAKVCKTCSPRKFAVRFGQGATGLTVECATLVALAEKPGSLWLIAGRYEYRSWPILPFCSSKPHDAWVGLARPVAQNQVNARLLLPTESPDRGIAIFPFRSFRSDLRHGRAAQFAACRIRR
jgi:hypothetical protein